MEDTVIEIKKTPVRDFVERHKVAIAVTATATACLVLNRIALRQHDEFLRDHDLYDEFYTPEENE